jgi:enoyl-CoA hydratase/carnithine racemase
VPRGTALNEALDLATRLAAGAPIAQSAAKRLLREGIELPLIDAIALEQEVGRQLFATADAKEGVAAFLGKRMACFEGR